MPSVRGEVNNYYGGKVDTSGKGARKLISLTAQESEALKTGASLFLVNAQKYVTIGEKISSHAVGGEGVVYKCNENDKVVIKIYHPAYRDNYKEAKLREMTKLAGKNLNSRICWPKDVVTYNGKFVGFVMSKASGETLNRLVSDSQHPGEFKAKMRQYDRKYQVKVILGILELFKELHSNGILVGDINTKNIMLNEADGSNITFVDMDSAQFSKYNCFTTSPGYDSPEVVNFKGEKNILKRNVHNQYEFLDYYEDYYRSIYNEYYAISVLIYKILMLELAPYSIQDHQNQPRIYKEDADEVTYYCSKCDFPYSTDDNVDFNDQTTWPYRVKLFVVWSHFPSFLKQAFVDTFSPAQKRYSVDEWIQIFTRYKELLDNGKLMKKDPDCLDYAPEDDVEFEKVVFNLTDAVEISGFSLSQIVARIAEVLKSNTISSKADDIVAGLSLNRKYVTNDNKYEFELVYNLGILKKVKCTEKTHT